MTATAATGAPVKITLEQAHEAFKEILGMPDDTAPCKYRLVREVGCGVSGTAFLVVNTETSEKLIAKVTDLSALSERKQAYARSEVLCLSQCNHFAVIKHHANFEAHKKLLLLMELADAGDLGRQIKHRHRARDDNGQPNYFKEHEVAFLFLQLVLAVDYMHRNGILHRDIKGANVFLMSVGIVKLGDLGFSQVYRDTVSNDVGKTFCGTPYYLAPELWRRFRYSKKADVWSIGVLLYEMAALERPFRGAALVDLYDSVMAGQYPPLPSHYSDELTTLIRSILTFDPHQRPDTGAILQSNYMQYVITQFERTISTSGSMSEEQRNLILRSVADAKRHAERRTTMTIGASPPPNVAPHRGKVQKYGQQGWRPRYLVFDGTHLTISNVDANVGDTKNVPIDTVQGILPVDPQDVGGLQGCFNIVLESGTGSRVYFQAESAAAALAWVDVVTRALECHAEAQARLLEEKANKPVPNGAIREEPEAADQPPPPVVLPSAPN